MRRFAGRTTSRPLVGTLLALSAGWLLFGCGDSPTGPGSVQLRPDVRSAPTAPVGPDLAEAIRAQERHTPALLANPGVVGTGVRLTDTGRPAVAVFLTRPDVTGVPDQLDRVPVVRVVTGLILAQSDPTSRARPAPLGYSVGHVDITAGSIGARVRNAAGAVFLLSNNHVLANSNAGSIGDDILQPGPYDGGTDPADRIGTLAAFQPIDFSLSGHNYIDAALASVSAADLGFATPDDGYGAPGATPYVLDSDGDGVVDGRVLGLGVQKFGRTTLLTKGQVEDVNVSVEVCYAVFFNICVQSAYFYDQLAFGPMSGGGDSGSLIVTDDANRSPVALLFAGSSTETIGNRIDRVLDHFGVVIDDGSGGEGGGGGTNAPPTASFTWSCTGLSCAFDGSGSSDPDGSVVSWSWDFGDGATGSGTAPSHEYAADGSYPVALTVTDDGGAESTVTHTVDVTSGSASEPTLQGTGRKVKGQNVVDLSWTGVPWSRIYVFRDGAVVQVLPGSPEGTYSDATGERGKATYTHFICEGTAATSQCSNPVVTSF